MVGYLIEQGGVLCDRQMGRRQLKLVPKARDKGGLGENSVGVGEEKLRSDRRSVFFAQLFEDAICNVGSTGFWIAPQWHDILTTE